MFQPANARLVPTVSSRSARIELDRLPSGPTHIVQFYENDHFLSAAVADFLAGGIESGEPVLVIATEPHRDAFTVRLKAKGVNVEQVSRSGQLMMLDARETLATFMEGAVPNPVRFRANIGVLIDALMAGGTHSSVRAYGEMVDLLWKDGNTEGAIRLEEMWNELASTHIFTLLCAYAMGNFYKEAHAGHFHDVCRQHAHVIPTERYTQGDDQTRMIEVSALQQRARALETEIEHRKDLELRLRDALAAHRRTEESLRQRELQLEELLVERGRLLERERNARSDAEAANRAKSEFLAVMSHELRTPLNAIGGYVQLIEMGIHGPVNAAQREALMRVERSQRHLLSLINDVLNLVRIEMGRVEYVAEEIRLAPLLADVTSMVEPLFAAKSLTYHVEAPKLADVHPALVVRADREKVQQILLNLLTNSIKFTPPGGRISVALAPSSGERPMVAVCVADTGIGIPCDKLESVFEPFVQLGTRPTTVHQGVGLGLAISRDLARAMGGDLTATSIEGEGCTFTLTLLQA